MGLNTHSAAPIGGTGHSAPGAVSSGTAQAGIDPAFFYHSCAGRLDCRGQDDCVDLTGNVTNNAKHRLHGLAHNVAVLRKVDRWNAVSAAF